MSPFKAVVSSVLKCLPPRFLRKLGYMCLRCSSGELRAFTELFVPPYHRWVDWRSGLGDSAIVLYALVRALQPNVIVEIGSARGKSTCVLALACQQNGKGKVYAIDPHITNMWTDASVEADGGHFLRSQLREYDLEGWCEVIQRTSREASEHWSKRIDLLFVDGDHTYEGVRTDFECFGPWLSENSLAVFHDTTWEYHSLEFERKKDIGVPRYLHELKRLGYQSVTIFTPPGLTILDPKPGGFPLLPRLVASAQEAEVPRGAASAGGPAR